MSTETNIYRLLQEHLDKSPVGYPATKSGVDISLLVQLFTPEEAEIATHLSTIKLEPIKTIHRRVKKSGKDMSVDELQKKLDRMARKGTILVYREKFRERRYRNTGVTAGGIVDFQVDRLTRDLVDTFHRYHQEHFAEAETTGRIGIPQLRTIPVETSIRVPGKYKVSTFDDARYLVEHAPGPLSVANCVCRQTKDIQGESCRYSDIRETCIQIGPDHARQYADMGIGRYITKGEALAILDRARQAGFILQPENSRNPENICCCCGDCCGLLSAVKKAPRPADMYASNYYTEVDATLCKGCGTCVKRCQLEARTLVDGKAVVNLDRCIGCGNCVVTCESGASRMIQKEQKLVPPKDKDTMFMNILEKKIGRWDVFKLKLKMLLGIRV
ncbi:MAG TPA: 4Fe-4S binding protein [Dehalococcoidia bacterium]|nr:4Fe-4S binding protein [Dehalococcoidia bacterium]